MTRLFVRRWFGRKPSLSAEQESILAALASGQTLKIHRNIDGEKVATLHALDGRTRSVSPAAVLDLRKRRLIETNHKFPAAAFLLTSDGQEIARRLRATESEAASPIAARNFVRNTSR